MAFAVTQAGRPHRAMRALAPCINKVRTYGSPRLEIPSCRILPPVPVCRGVSPSQRSYPALCPILWLRSGYNRRGDSECFFVKLKMECVWQCSYANHADVKRNVENYIAGLYNCERLDSYCLICCPASAYAQWDSANLSWVRNYLTATVIAGARKAQSFSQRSQRC